MGRHEASGDSMDELQSELRLLDEEIEQARRAAAETRRAIGGRDEGAVDMADRAAAIEQAEEQEELVGILMTRRGRLQERLDRLGSAM